MAAAAAAAAATTKSKVKAKTKAKVEANQQQEEDSEEDGEACEICRSSAATGLPMLLCDGARCGKGFHAVCVGLDAAPEQEVYLGR